MDDAFSMDCRECRRLAAFLDGVRKVHPDYHARPVPMFGDAAAGLLVLGLAPGMHGANRSGRPFTGDHAGILLYRMLHKFGFASSAVSVNASDPMILTDCRITNAVKCLPPQNKPLPAEIRTCNRYLAAELRAAPPRVMLALGTVAHQAALMAWGLKSAQYRFAHHARHDLPPTVFAPRGVRLYDSYHCSRYNTQTKRLTETMFEAVFRDIAAELKAS